MPKNNPYFTPIEQTFVNYEKTKANHPLLPKDVIDRVTGVVKTVDTKQVYEDLEPAFAQLKHILNGDVATDDAAFFAHDSMLARMGAFMLYCSLIENRLRAMYRQRMAVINGTHTLTAAEEAELYENLPNEPQNKHKLKRDVTEAHRIATFLLWCHDVDLHTFHLLEQFTKVRNALVHDAMFRSAYVDNQVLRFLRSVYTHMQNMRTKMNGRLQRERELYADDALRAARIVDRLEGLSLGARIARDELYQRLAGSTRLDTPMVNRRFCYVVAPTTERGTTWTIQLKQPVKLLDKWTDKPAPWSAPTPLFRETESTVLVEFCGYGVVTEIVADLKGFRGLKITYLN
jgi:hypothetical protein